MAPKSRDQWQPNTKLQAAREQAFGLQSRAKFGRAVKRRCEERFGGHCGVDHRKVRRWEEGASQPDASHQQVICDALSVPWEERERLGFLTPDRSEVSPYLAGGTLPVPGIVIMSGQWAGFEADAARTNPIILEPSEYDIRSSEHPVIIEPGAPTALPRELNGSRALDPQLLDDLEALVNIYRRLDRKLGAPAIVAGLVNHFKSLSVLKNLPTTLTTRQRLAAHAADVATLAGWQLLDMGQLVKAWNSFRSAATAAREAEDAELHAFVVAEMSYVPLLAGRVREAKLLVAQAEHISGRSTSPVFRAWLSGVRAEVSSMAKDEVGSLGALERAAVMLQEAAAGESPIPCISYFNMSHLTRWEGQCLAQLGRSSEAQVILEEALTSVDGSFVRARAGITLDLANAYLQQDRLESACDQVRQALGLARRTRSVRYQHRVVVFRSQLEPYADSPAVQRLDEELGRVMEG